MRTQSLLRTDVGFTGNPACTGSRGPNLPGPRGTLTVVTYNNILRPTADLGARIKSHMRQRVFNN